jgi:hypothetical protein
MDTHSNSTTNAVGAGETTPAQNPVDPLTFVAQLRAMRQSVPDYTQLPITQRRPLQSLANRGADSRLVEAAINGLAESPLVQQALGRSPEDVRQETADADAWNSVETELRALLSGVATANLLRRHRIGDTALKVYAIAKGLVRDEAHKDLLPHVETLKRVNRARVQKRSSDSGQPPQTPAGKAT